jgi:hypothetical protein
MTGKEIRQLMEDGRDNCSPCEIASSQENAFNLSGPLGVPISPDLLCW